MKLMNYAEQCGGSMSHQEDGDDNGGQDADARDEVSIHTQCRGVGVRSQKACPADGNDALSPSSCVWSSSICPALRVTQVSHAQTRAGN